MDKQIKLEIEELEERIAPATLYVFPGGGAPQSGNAPPFNGLTVGGAPQWAPGSIGAAQFS